MVLKKAVKETRKKTLEDAKIFMGWLYDGKDNVETVSNLEKSFLEELKLMTGECVATVEIFAEFADGSKCSGRALLRDIVSTGIDLPEDVANFYIDLKVLRTDKPEHNILNGYNQQIFRSDIFYIQENTKTKIDEADGIVIKNMDKFTAMCGGHIRFKALENSVEV